MSDSIKMEDPSIVDVDGIVWNMYALDYRDDVSGKVFSLDIYANNWADAHRHLNLIKKNGDITGQITGREI